MTRELKALLFTALLLFTSGSILLYNPLIFLFILGLLGLAVITLTIYYAFLLILKKEEKK